MNTRVQKIARLRNKKYRDSFVASQISVGLPFQIRALREQRGWKQSQLAGKAEMLQPRISAMERPGGAKFNLETLRRLASAFDVALVVRFAPFSELVDWSDTFHADTFTIPSFDHDAGVSEPEQEPAKAVAALLPSILQSVARISPAYANSVDAPRKIQMTSLDTITISLGSGTSLKGDSLSIDTVSELGKFTAGLTGHLGLRIPPLSTYTSGAWSSANG
jgi:transcriptional regulator with XRE-family HTH domain